VAGRMEMGYDLLGRQVNQRWPNGLSETRTYDSASRLLAITPGQQDKKGAPTITYAYDQRGNRLTMDRSDVGLSRYTYDEISQLLTAALPDGDFQTYTFDPVGNRLSLKDSRGLQTYEYDEADELLEVESDFNPEQPSMTGPLMTRLGASDANRPLFKTVYGWDADGNQVSKTGPGSKASHYGFDALDRLVGVSAPGSEPEKYFYNADRQRIATVHGKDSVSERFLHLGRGRQVLGDLDGSGKLTKRYVFLPSGQLLAHVDSSANKPAFYHFDALGSTAVMSDSAARITARFFYDSYGVTRYIPLTDERYGYVGREGVGNTNSGLQEMGLRYYDPFHGRFLSREPLTAYPFLGSRYSYAMNNPLTVTDPSGLHPSVATEGRPLVWHTEPGWDNDGYHYHDATGARYSSNPPPIQTASRNSEGGIQRVSEDEARSTVTRWLGYATSAAEGCAKLVLKVIKALIPSSEPAGSP